MVRQIIDILLKMLLFAGGLFGGYQLAIFSEETKCIVSDNFKQPPPALPKNVPDAKPEPWFPPNNQVKWSGSSRPTAPIGLVRIRDESRQENHLIQVLPRYQNSNSLSAWISVRHGQTASVRLPAGVYRAVLHSWAREDNYGSSPERALKTTQSFTITADNQREIALYGRGGLYIMPLPEPKTAATKKNETPVDEDAEEEAPTT